jgi:hypothetical protein
VFEDECRSVGLTPAQFGALSVLHAARTGPVQPGANELRLRMTMRIIRGLETRGMIARVRTPGDPPQPVEFHWHLLGWHCCIKLNSLQSEPMTG